uniref:Uncharacterized protein n=1 Tax=Panagrolaimus superbus TaxID=310955 RepID=A0A914YKC6_9BILA
MRSPAYRLQIRNLGVQLFPGKVKEFLSAYDDSTSLPWGYLVINLHTKSNPLLALTTSILPDQNPIIYKLN